MYLRRNNKTKMEVSIDEPLNVDWDGNELLLSDILGTDEDVISRDLETETEKSLLNLAVSRLSPRERKIVQLRYGLNREDGEEMTQKEVADLLGISQSYISRLEKKIMKRLACLRWLSFLCLHFLPICAFFYNPLLKMCKTCYST